MAHTEFTTNNALTKKLWDEKLFRDSRKESYFERFMGEGPDSLVHVKTQLEKSQGDKITFGIRMRLTGAGQTGDDAVEGNEEALSTYDDSVSLEQYRHGVRDKGRLTRKRAMFSITSENEAALKTWGSEKIDSLCFTAIQDTPTQVVYPSGAGGTLSSTATAATAKGALHATGSLITPGLIRFAKTLAKKGKVGSTDRTFVPIRPVKFDGKEWYILLVSPEVLFDLKQNSTFEQANREAQQRGNDNPIFSGSQAIYDGVVIHEHESISNFADGGGAAVTGSTCVLMGAQSLVWAWGERPEVVQESFDYKNQVGYAWSMMCKTKKPKFNSVDYGSLGVYVSRSI